MSSSRSKQSLIDKTARRARELVQVHQQQIYQQTDRLFAILMAVQWVAGVAAAVWILPRAWEGRQSHIHLHVWAAIFIGFVISSFPVALALLKPGHKYTRYTIAA